MKSAGGICSLRGEGEDTRTCLMGGGVMLFCCLDLEVEPRWYSCSRKRRGLKQFASTLSALPVISGGWVGRVECENLLYKGG